MNNEELEQRVINLTSRIYELENKVSELSNIIKQENKSPEYFDKAETKPCDYTASTSFQNTKSTETVIHRNSSNLNSKDVPYKQHAANNSATSNNVQPQQATQSTPKNVVLPKKTTTVESQIGKNIMGIAASVLVLISLILFGGLLYPHMSDPIKVLLMYGISFAFAITGIWKIDSKSKYQTLFACFAGCGISAIYLSTLITYFYFQLTSFWVTNIILMLWLVGTAYLAKYKSKMFLYICNVGLFIASTVVNFNLLLIPTGLILYFIGITVLFATNRNQIFTKDCYFFTQIHILSIIFIGLYHYSPVITLVIATINFIILLSEHYFYDIKSDKESIFSITNQSFTMLDCLLALNCASLFTPYEYVLLVLVGVILTIIQYYKYNINNKKLWITSYYLTLASTLLCNEGFIENYLSLAPICFIILIIDYFINNNHFKYSSIFFIYYAIRVPPSKLGFCAIFIITLLFIAYYIFKYLKTRYSIIEKFILSYLFFISLFVLFSSYKVSEFIIFVTLALLSVFFNSSIFRENMSKKEEKISVAASYIYNFIILLIGIYQTVCFKDPYAITASLELSPSVTGLIIILLTIVLSVLNIKHLYQSSLPEKLVGCYTCTKLLIVLLFIMSRLQFVSLLVSLVTILFAIGCIAIGFKMNNKTSRLYGLGVNLLFILKLILFDIEYDNVILRPLSFLVAGILCFVISWLYSKLEKQISK